MARMATSDDSGLLSRPPSSSSASCWSASLVNAMLLAAATLLATATAQAPAPGTYIITTGMKQNGSWALDIVRYFWLERHLVACAVIRLPVYGAVSRCHPCRETATAVTSR